MAIDIRGLGNQEALAQIAKLAYGSGSSEKTSGGKGNIGLLDGRVVKFNTHFGERGGKPSDEMRASCNELRARLSEIAMAMLANGNDASARALASVRRALGIDAKGNLVETRKLLDRKAVAKVMNVLRDATGYDAWGELRAGDAQSLSSKGVVTTFARVSEDLAVADAVRQHVQGAVEAIAHPADGRPGVVLGEEATKFLMDLVERDLRDPERRAAADLADVARGIRDFSSPYLIVTLQTFNLSSAVLSHAYRGVRHADQISATLVGSPRGQRADRADIALGFLRNEDDLSYVSFALALVAEKLPKMRRLQPQGRLTGATVWKACFGESVPKAAGALGSRSFTNAFVARMVRLTVALTAKHGPEGVKGEGVTIDHLLMRYQLVGVGLFNGAGFTAAIRKGIGDPKFVPDATRDYVSAQPLYAAQDALVKTDDDLEKALVKDFKRNFPVITFDCGGVEETADFRPFVGQRLSDEQHLQNARALVGQVERVFGDRITHVQRNLLLIGLTQVGYLPFTALLGVGGEHTQAAVNVRREDDGAVILTVESLPDNRIEARYSYRIEPDGTNGRVGEFVCRERPLPKPAPRPARALTRA